MWTRWTVGEYEWKAPNCRRGEDPLRARFPRVAESTSRMMDGMEFEDVQRSANELRVDDAGGGLRNLGSRPRASDEEIERVGRTSANPILSPRLPPIRLKTSPLPRLQAAGTRHVPVPAGRADVPRAEEVFAAFHDAGIDGDQSLADDVQVAFQLYVLDGIGSPHAVVAAACRRAER